MKTNALAVVTVLSALALGAAPARADTIVLNGGFEKYHVTELGTLDGNCVSLAYAINNSAKVAGVSLGSTAIPTIWKGTTPISLGLPTGATQSQANGINNRGQVVGDSANAAGGRATVWNGTTPTLLGLLPGTTVGDAYAINNRGIVAGVSYTKNYTLPVIWHGTTPRAWSAAWHEWGRCLQHQ
jgi:uncharacterized membrane protein